MRRKTRLQHCAGWPRIPGYHQRSSRLAPSTRFRDHRKSAPRDEIIASRYPTIRAWPASMRHRFSRSINLISGQGAGKCLGEQGPGPSASRSSCSSADRSCWAGLGVAIVPGYLNRRSAARGISLSLTPSPVWQTVRHHVPLRRGPSPDDLFQQQSDCSMGHVCKLQKRETTRASQSVGMSDLPAGVAVY